MSDINRKSINSISYLLKSFPCVAILGVRQAGKSTLLKQILPKTPFFDLQDSTTLEAIRTDIPFFLSQHSKPCIFDEAQDFPELFPALRVAIDGQRSTPGQFLLSGSSSPHLLSQITESLAGRIALFELSPFVLEESWNKQTIFYECLINKKFDLLPTLEPTLNRAELMESLFYGGYPEPFLKRKDKTFFNLWMSNYFETYIQRDMRRLFPGLNLTTFQRFVRMLATASGTLINMSLFAKSLDVSQPTVKNYFNITDGTYIWRILPSFHTNKIKSATHMPKGYLRDSGLLNFLLNIHNLEELQHHVYVGILWESFVVEQIIRSLKILLYPFNYYHYRTKNDAEIDLILEGEFGLIPVEVKYGYQTGMGQLKTLNHFVKEHSSPCGLVVNMSEKAAQLSEKIYQIPAGCL